MGAIVVTYLASPVFGLMLRSGRGRLKLGIELFPTTLRERSSSGASSENGLPSGISLVGSIRL